jgi:dsDNA-binding SOS-regulon protein
MSGKSAAIILRQMHHQVVSEAARYDKLIDFPAWLSTLSEHPNAITFAEQKRREAEQILAHD